jgi:hypothetical protein
MLFNVVDNIFGPFRKQGEPISEPDRNNFGPRLGLSWDIGGSSRNVIRAGAGMYYSPSAPRHITNMTGPPGRPFFVTLFGSDGYRLPVDEAALFADPDRFPAITGRTVLDTHARTSYSMQYSFNYQRMLASNLVLETGYIGTRGLKLMDIAHYNQPDLVFGTQLAPELGRIDALERSGMSTYHALQTSLRKRFSHGFQLNGNYTYGKTITVGSIDTFGGSDSPEVQDHTDRRASRGRAGNDLTHVFVLDYAWDIPLQTWLPAQSSAMGRLVNGWKVMGITSSRSGFPIYVRSGLDNRGTGNSIAQRPDLRTDVSPKMDDYHESSNHLFLNPAAFADPCSSRQMKRPCGIYGNLGKNVLSGPSAFNFDFSVMKETTVTERSLLQFRMEFFNLLNVVNFDNPNAQLSSGTFGRITSAAAAREIQLALKLIF